MKTPLALIQGYAEGLKENVNDDPESREYYSEVIIDEAEKIGTFETSILPYEDCCTIFVAKHPVTKPDPAVIRESEKKLADVIDEMVREAVDTAEEIRISPQ